MNSFKKQINIEFFSEDSGNVNAKHIVLLEEAFFKQIFSQLCEGFTSGLLNHSLSLCEEEEGEEEETEYSGSWTIEDKSEEFAPEGFTLSSGEDVIFPDKSECCRCTDLQKEEIFEANIKLHTGKIVCAEHYPYNFGENNYYLMCKTSKGLRRAYYKQKLAELIR
jgi:hypothetical protein